MSFYYVKSGGTATGDAGRAATARTGTFAAMGASAYYDSVYDVFAGAVPTTAPDGDVIICADDHSENYTSTTQLSIASTNTGKVIVVKSVDVTDVSVDKVGAEIKSTGGGIDLRLGLRVTERDGVVYQDMVLNAGGQADFYARASSVLCIRCLFI